MKMFSIYFKLCSEWYFYLFPFRMTAWHSSQQMQEVVIILWEEWRSCWDRGHVHWNSLTGCNRSTRRKSLISSEACKHEQSRGNRTTGKELTKLPLSAKQTKILHVSLNSVGESIQSSFSNKIIITPLRKSQWFAVMNQLSHFDIKM